MKLYVVSNSEDGKEDIDGLYFLVSENGECLSRHFSSNKYFAKSDLVRGSEHLLEEKYGDYEVLFLGDDGSSADTLKKLFTILTD